MQQETTTQGEKLGEMLQRIKPDVTKEDRIKAQNKFQITNATVSRYLDGDVRNNDLGADLIVLFKSRIAQRNKVLIN